MANAPLTGGYSPGADRYAVSGDLSIAYPVTAPMMMNLFRGDSIVSINDIVLLDTAATFEYVRVPFNTGANIQPLSPNQSAIVFEQEFVVAQQYFTPLPLNTPYYLPWSVGWQNTFVNLAECFLVEEGALIPLGGGVSKFMRKYANLPPNRNVPGSWSQTFPALDYGGDSIRFPFQKIADTRVQHDYYLWDPLNLQSGTPLFPAGHRLNLSTGMRPLGLILPEMRYFKAEVDSVQNNNQLDPGQPVSDEGIGTMPSYTDYKDYMDNQCEIVAEASNLGEGPILGNIYERRTRFVVAE